MAVIGGAGAGYGAATEEVTEEKINEGSDVAQLDSAVAEPTPIAAAAAEPHGTDKSSHVPDAANCDPWSG